MYYGNSMQRYRETDIGTMTPEKIIAMLYDRAIRDLEQAATCLERGERAETTRLVNHSQAIISELRNALDMAAGGEVAANLENLYDWLFRQHLALLAGPSAELIADCVRVMQPLADAWRAVASGAANANLSLQAAAAGPDPASRFANGPGRRDAGGPVPQHNLLSVTV